MRTAPLCGRMSSAGLSQITIAVSSAVGAAGLRKNPSNRRVKLQVMKVRLYSPSNELLAEM